MYKEFSQFYDKIMDNVPYDEWASFIIKKIHQHSPQCKNILDIACGTGNITYYLKQEFKVTGTDISNNMLSIAKQKNPECNFIKADMSKNLPITEKFDAITCIYDSLNYLATEEQLYTFFENCKKNLNKGGILIFDIITMAKIRNLFKNNVFTMENKDFFSIWYNKFVTKDLFINDLVFFIRNNDDKYTKYKEKHKRRIFSGEIILDSAKKNSFVFKANYDGFSENKTDKYSERILYIFRREDF
ncbi:MAG: class I SAM-dependent methyltransferase [Candidatus Muirbacterium halophilum]|nr:class I SAM-dependent methyltransferase [Candidatus Muirbacterium halophilum]MCK9475764.1 class I SAM-dependent methyltransferase [Candidatus Muirbacterium halophilum]